MTFQSTNVGRKLWFLDSHWSARQQTATGTIFYSVTVCQLLHSAASRPLRSRWMFVVALGIRHAGSAAPTAGTQARRWGYVECHGTAASRQKGHAGGNTTKSCGVTGLASPNAEGCIVGRRAPHATAGGGARTVVQRHVIVQITAWASSAAAAKVVAHSLSRYAASFGAICWRAVAY